MSPEYFYINFLQSRYSVRGVINFNHFLSSPLLVQGIWLTLQQLNWFFPSFLFPHSLQPLSRKGPEALLSPTPKLVESRRDAPGAAGNTYHLVVMVAVGDVGLLEKGAEGRL